MEDLKGLINHSVVLLEELNRKADDHSRRLGQISESTKVMTGIESSIERIAACMESSEKRADDMVKKAMNVLEGKGVIEIRSHILSHLIMGLLYTISIIAIAKMDFHGETANGTKASIRQHVERMAEEVP